MGKDSFVVVAVILTRLTTWVKTLAQESWWEDWKDIQGPLAWTLKEQDLHSNMQIKNGLYFTPDGFSKIALDLLKRFKKKKFWLKVLDFCIIKQRINDQLLSARHCSESTVHVLNQLIFKVTLRHKDNYYSHFTGEKTPLSLNQSSNFPSVLQLKNGRLSIESRPFIFRVCILK